MLPGKLQSAREKTIPIAMMFVAVGMILQIFAIVWPEPLVAAHAGTHWDNFLHGLAFGVAIGFEIAGLMTAVAARAPKSAESKL